MIDCDKKKTHNKKGTMTGPLLRKSALSERLRRENGFYSVEAFSAFKAENAFLFYRAVKI